MVNSAFVLLCARDHARRRRLVKILTLVRIRIALKERNYLISSSLIHPPASTWHYIYESRDRGSFISVVSLVPDAFEQILCQFSRHYTVKSGPGRRGRPPKFVAKHAVLAGLLHLIDAYAGLNANETVTETSNCIDDAA